MVPKFPACVLPLPCCICFPCGLRLLPAPSRLAFSSASPINPPSAFPTSLGTPKTPAAFPKSPLASFG